jgi:putative molybdopterin biosynthesis protein
VARDQEQFLDVVDRDEAERIWLDSIRPHVLEAESAALREALGRVLAADVISGHDVPAFDRSNVDGYAVRALETFGAAEESPRRFKLNREEILTGVVPTAAVAAGTATAITTGGMLPRGADAVAMIEQTTIREGSLVVLKAVAPGTGVTFAGTDIAKGEVVLRRATRLTSRETGVLAAIGQAEVQVVRRPRVGILSTGDEIVSPGRSLELPSVYDSNATMLADAVRELGGQPVNLGIVADSDSALTAALESGLDLDLLLLSGGTSKGAGDLSYRVLARRTPGILVHGVALKPGKPVCLGAVGSTPVAILPGFPTSAIFTFHAFVAPLLRRFQGLRPEDSETVAAILPARVNSERGRTEFLLVRLVRGPEGTRAYPMGTGSGSVTSFSRADGFIVIGRQEEYLEAGERVSVNLLGRGAAPADLVAIGSHCIGLDLLLGLLADQGFTSKTLWVGSQGGLAAAGRGECDLAGVHLLVPETGTYNTPFLPSRVRLCSGYGRMQGFVFRPGDARFMRTAPEAVAKMIVNEERFVMVNRNRGSGTRVLIERLLGVHRPQGYSVEARSHNAVAAAVAQGRADWGVAISPVATAYGLGFLPLQAEQYDFAIPEDRWDRPPVAAFRRLLETDEVRERLTALGFLPRKHES